MSKALHSLSQKPWFRRIFSLRNVAMGLTVASIFSILATYYAIAQGNQPFGPDPHRVMALILINLLLLLCLAAVVLRRAFGLWHSLRHSSSSSHLQKRILVMFSLLTITPAVLVSLFAIIFFHSGVQAWFHQRIDTALQESVTVASAYLTEHREIIRSDAIAMANDLDIQAHNILGNPALLNRIVNSQATLRSLTEGVIVQRNRIIAQTALSFSLAFEQVNNEKLDQAASGDVAVWLEDRDKLRAMVRLHSMPDTYLIIGRLVDEKVIQHVDSATGAVAEYRRLKANLEELQIQFSLIFGLVVLLLLLAAIWFGMHFAARLVIPITRLIKAAERVRSGDFAVKVPISTQNDEVATLGRAFNRMTEELSRQREELIEANQQIDERRRFSEAVLAGITAGVLALNQQKQITLYNRSAAALLPLPEHPEIQKTYAWQILPELESLLAEAESKPEKMTQRELNITQEGRSCTLLARITVERFRDHIEGYIITFDDITDLLIAQRNAAWSDVARRVAHEIKNPLTPIQLAAERLRKKYSKQIVEDNASYIRYIDTISRHVGDIGKMVEEFVAFARMPAPMFQMEDLEAIIKKIIFSEQVAHPKITYNITNQKARTQIWADEQQLSRLFINLFKNAAEAIQKENGIIDINLSNQNENLMVLIKDNGPGFPIEHLHRLMEPYVTTRDKGTGLGLAIAQKIMEEHHGEIRLENHPQGGAQVTLIFPLDSGKNVT